jgi:hypothetical protein
VTSKIKELQLFLEAAQMLGGENWTPNPEQWKMIRQKIIDLPDITTPATVAPHHVPPAWAPANSPLPTPPHVAGPVAGGMFAPVEQAPIPASHQQNSLLPVDSSQPAKIKVMPDGTADPKAFL